MRRPKRSLAMARTGPCVGPESAPGVLLEVHRPLSAPSLLYANSPPVTDPIPTERKRVWTTPANVALCPEADIADPGSRGFVLQIRDAFFHGFVVRKGGEVAGWVDRCPHMGFPVAVVPDRYLTPDGRVILCGWHGAVFDPIDGKCVGGPCAGARLTPWPVAVVDGIIRTA